MAFQRVESAIHQKLEVTGLARAQISEDQRRRRMLQLLRRIVRDVKLGDRGKVGGDIGARLSLTICGRGQPVAPFYPCAWDGTMLAILASRILAASSS